MNVSILIQGHVTEECYNYYCNNYLKYPVIISTWDYIEIDFSKKPDNFIILKNKMPSHNGHQNSNLQITSTLYGLDIIKSKFVIKIRGDEYYSNIEEIIKSIYFKPNKIHMAPVFFRHPNSFPFHGSDHLIAGTRDNLLKMFVFNNWSEADLKCLKLVQNKTDFNPHLVVEQNLTKNFLEKVSPNFNENPVLSMLLNLEILDLTRLIPYKITSNCFGRVFYNNFVPQQNGSVSNIEEIFY
jgi:hypothetical protein